MCRMLCNCILCPLTIKDIRRIEKLDIRKSYFFPLRNIQKRIIDLKNGDE